MADTTVKQLAEIVGTPVDRLLQQMQEAGCRRRMRAMVDEAQKESLLAFSARTENPKAGQKDHASANTQYCKSWWIRGSWSYCQRRGS